MTHFYTPERAKKSRLRAQISLATACAMILIAWAVCAYLCTRVRTANAALLFRWVLALSAGSGWTAILLISLAYSPARAEARHMESILKGPAEEAAGVLTLYPEEFRIPRGIRVRKARLDTPDGPVSLRLDASLAPLLPVGRSVRVQVVRQFITGWEDRHESD